MAVWDNNRPVQLSEWPDIPSRKTDGNKIHSNNTLSINPNQQHSTNTPKTR